MYVNSSVNNNPTLKSSSGKELFTVMIVLNSKTSELSKIFYHCYQAGKLKHLDKVQMRLVKTLLHFTSSKLNKRKEYSQTLLS